MTNDNPERSAPAEKGATAPEPASGNGRHSRLPGGLIVLIGVDGVGKTTLSRLVAKNLAELGVKELPHRTIGDAEPHVEQSMSGIADLLWPKVNTAFDHLLPAHFYIFLKAAWYSLFSELVAKPRLEQGQTLLTDGWYYKFIAKMTLDGFAEPYLNKIFSHVSEPDLVIMLDTDIPHLWERRSDFRHHELGLHEGYSELGRQSFIDYQTKVRQVLLEMAQRDGWDILWIEKDASIADASALLEARIAGWLRER